MAPASVYLGGLPETITKNDLREHLSIYGTVNALNVQKGYSFAEFESEADALDLVNTFSNQPFMGQMCKIQLARKPRRQSTCSEQTTPSPELTRAALRSVSDDVRIRYPVVVNNLNPRTCWQELKDFGRRTGSTVAFCDIDRFNRNRGFLEYYTQEDADRVAEELDGADLLGNIVSLTNCGRKILREEFRSRSRSPGPFATRKRTRSPLPSRAENTPSRVSRSPERHEWVKEERASQLRGHDQGHMARMERRVHFSEAPPASRDWRAHSPARHVVDTDDLLYASDERKDRMERIASEWLAYERLTV